jgi:general secretion pathway protein A
MPRSDVNIDVATPRAGTTPYHDLWTKPFRESTDASVLWLGPPYRDAFGALRTGILGNGGVLLLTGEAGSGKTMLASALADGLGAEGMCVAKLTHGGLEPADLRHAVAQALALPAAPDTPEAFRGQLGDFLRDVYERRARVLLYIDEAQDLDAGLLDEIVQLVRVGREAGHERVNVLNVLLVGHSELEASLRRREVSGIAAAIRTRARLDPLRPRDVADYIAFRLRGAGADRELFSREAIRVIGAASSGVPRRINRICDCALQTAWQRNLRAVSAGVVRDAIRDWGLEAGSGGRRRFRPSGGVRWVLSAAALTVAVGLGAAFYYAGGHGPARDRPTSVHAEAPGSPADSGRERPAVTADVEPPTAGGPAARPRPMRVDKAPGAEPGVAPDRSRRRPAEGLRNARRRPTSLSADMTAERRPVAGRPDDSAANVERLLRYQAP